MTNGVRCSMVVGLPVLLGAALWAQAGRTDLSATEPAVNAIQTWEKKTGIALSTDVRSGIIKDYRDANEWFRSRKDSPTSAEFDKALGPAIQAYLDDIRDDDRALSLSVHISEQLGRAPFGLPRKHALGVVKITTRPAEASVSIDGADLSSAKVRLVAAGRHQLRATLRSYVDCVVSVDVKVGETAVECVLVQTNARP